MQNEGLADSRERILSSATALFAQSITTLFLEGIKGMAAQKHIQEGANGA